jgi:hypothetical protein
MGNILVKPGANGSELHFSLPFSLNSSETRTWYEIIGRPQFPNWVGKGTLDQFIRALMEFPTDARIVEVTLTGSSSFIIRKAVFADWVVIQRNILSRLAAFIPPGTGHLTIAKSVETQQTARTTNYRVIDFDVEQFALKMIPIVIASSVATLLNQVVSLTNPPWLAAGANGVLFVVILILSNLYLAALIAILITGSEAWNKVIVLIGEPDGLSPEDQEKKIKAALAKRPDSFLAIALCAIWIIMLVVGIFVYFPIELCWTFTLIALITGMLVIFAFDYWGFTDGIKRIEKT